MHVLNRSVGRATIFASGADYELVLSTLAEAQRFQPMRVLGYCVMPNHWHLVLWPREDGELSRFMHWFTLTHTQRWHRVHETTGTGPIYQGRFKSFPVHTQDYLLTLLRYVERNAQAAALVASSLEWRWGSLRQRVGRERRAVELSRGPVQLPVDWTSLVDRPLGSSDLRQIEVCVARGAPLGPADWRSAVAARLGLTSSLRAAGRPRGAST